ncbi:hypothetical protein VTL71DRAFT_9362 [Oculimacula yallundae]|uniref:Nudix hydrolase domain-containing protein n=1 Tax=Oculimacula yallundae TaxID=86028 RepID=A0ABR4BUD4_9HELO
MAVPQSLDESMYPLDLSQEEFCAHLYTTQNRKFDKLVVGAAIIKYVARHDSECMEPQILLLKRSATEIYYPNVFEVPGGNVDPDDPNIKAAVCREVREETGLEVTKVLVRLPDMIYFTEKKIEGNDGTTSLAKKACIQLNFGVEVDLSQDFQVNPDEHSTGVWADRKMLGELEMTAEMKDLVETSLNQFTNKD